MDESHIAFVHAIDRPWGDVWVVPTEGGPAWPVTAGGEVTGKPAWTPDGRLPGYARVNADTDDVIQVTLIRVLNRDIWLMTLKV